MVDPLLQVNKIISLKIKQYIYPRDDLKNKNNEQCFLLLSLFEYLIILNKCYIKQLFYYLFYIIIVHFLYINSIYECLLLSNLQYLR